MPPADGFPATVPEPDASDLGDTAPQTPRRGPSLFTLDHPGLVSPLNLVFVRHGVTEATTSHVFSGSSKPGPKLSPEGRDQANAAADAVYRIGRDRWRHLPRVSRVIASPMTRTQETARAIGLRLGIEVETDERLKEMDFGSWEGLTGHEILERFGDDIHRWRKGEIPAPGGESIPEVGRRLDVLVRELAREHADRCVAGDDERRAYALASHAVAIKSIVGLSMRMDLGSWGSGWPQPASTTILELRVTQEGEIDERHLLCMGETVA
jgi:broad specificity phosphatase PhoE